jgi:hypothetical protein
MDDSDLNNAFHDDAPAGEDSILSVCAPPYGFLSASPTGK